MTRAKGKQWYVGGLNGKGEAQTFKISFDFLDKGNFNLQLIKDGNDDKSFATEMIKVKKSDTIRVKCLPRGGFVGVIKPEKMHIIKKR